MQCVAFLPDRALLVFGSEDGLVFIKDSNTYCMEQLRSLDLDRSWLYANTKGFGKVALGFVKGDLLWLMGKDDHVALMNLFGKVVLTKEKEVSTINLGTVQRSTSNGERLPVSARELDFCGLYPQTLTQSPNGRFVAVCSDEEYTVYTALNLRDQSTGSADEKV